MNKVILIPCSILLVILPCTIQISVHNLTTGYLCPPKMTRLKDIRWNKSDSNSYCLSVPWCYIGSQIL